MDLIMIQNGLSKPKKEENLQKACQEEEKSEEEL